jgi:hypothetical protein
MAHIQLNGAVFYPSNTETTIRKHGTSLIAANGTRRWIQRGHKRQFALSWERAPLATLTALTTIALLTTTFPYVDPFGTTYTVQCEDEALRYAVGLIARQAGAVVLYYDIQMTIFEA